MADVVILSGLPCFAEADFSWAFSGKPSSGQDGIITVLIETDIFL